MIALVISFCKIPASICCTVHYQTLNFPFLRTVVSCTSERFNVANESRARFDEGRGCQGEVISRQPQNHGTKPLGRLHQTRWFALG